MFVVSLVAIRLSGRYAGKFHDMEDNLTRFEVEFQENDRKSVGIVKTKHYSEYIPKKVIFEKVSDFEDYDVSFEIDGTFTKIVKLEFNLTGENEYICSSLTDDMSHDVNGLISPRSIEFLLLRHDDQLWFRYILRPIPPKFSKSMIKFIIGVSIYMIIGITLIFKCMRKPKKGSKKE